MAILNDLVVQIENPALRERIAAEVDKLAKKKKFGLVFEEHLPECTPLWDIPVRKGSKVSLRTGAVSDFYTVLKIKNGRALCLNKDKSSTAEFAIDDLVSIAEFGEPIYPKMWTSRTTSSASAERAIILRRKAFIPTPPKPVSRRERSNFRRR